MSNLDMDCPGCGHNHFEHGHHPDAHCPGDFTCYCGMGYKCEETDCSCKQCSCKRYSHEFEP